LRDARKRQRFEALARPELDALFRTAWRIVGRRAVAEEIVQEACLRAYASFDVSDEPAAFRPWLFRIAVNLALDHTRREQHEAASGHTDATTSAVPDATLAGQPHALVEGREIGRALDRALAAVPPELRSAAILVLIEEMSYAEAAVALAITESLVRSRLSRARAELRRHLATHGADLMPRPVRSGAPSTLPATPPKRGPQ
jgi:RNA polymerase sigma-70 factor, ECF subfamily